eukprot:scaffold165889_cov18-Tisochrysis_lutea.AAC.1
MYGTDPVHFEFECHALCVNGCIRAKTSKNARSIDLMSHQWNINGSSSNLKAFKRRVCTGVQADIGGVVHDRSSICKMALVRARSDFNQNRLLQPNGIEA